MRHPVIEEDLRFIVGNNLPWEELEGKTVLISGANGFLPAYLVETILFLNEARFRKKARVLALVRSPDKARSRFRHYQGREDLVFMVQDVCAPVAVDGDVHFILHAASQASPKLYGSDPVGTLATNVFGTRNLLDLAVQKKTSGFLFFSSGEIYGIVPPEALPIKEDTCGYLDPTALRSCYAESKRMGETMCVAWHHQHGVPARIARPFHTYGPGISLEDGRVFSDFVASVVRNRDIILHSDGSARRPFCYIADAAVAFFLILLKGQSGTAYNVGNDEGEISIRDLAQLMVSLFPERNLKVRFEERPKGGGYVPGNIRRNLPDVSRLKGLGWAPRYSLEEGFRRTVRSFSDE